MDVHAAATVWCLPEAQGDVVGEGRTATTAVALTALMRELGPSPPGARPSRGRRAPMTIAPVEPTDLPPYTFRQRCRQWRRRASALAACGFFLLTTPFGSCLRHLLLTGKKN